MRDVCVMYACDFSFFGVESKKIPKNDTPSSFRFLLNIYLYSDRNISYSMYLIILIIYKVEILSLIS